MAYSPPVVKYRDASSVIDAVDIDEIVYDDWEEEGGWDNSDNISIAHSVIESLESLDTDLILEKDIDAYIAFLKTPIGKYEEGAKKCGEYKSRIDYKERTRKYRHKYPYNFQSKP